MYDYDYLAHFGVKGMKWGVRRYRNEDGTLTPRGQKHEARMKRRREKALASNNPKYVYKNRKLLTDAELRVKTNQFQANQNLRNVAYPKKNSELRKKAKQTLVNETIKYTIAPVLAIAGKYAVSKVSKSRTVEVGKDTVDYFGKRWDWDIPVNEIGQWMFK